MVRLRLSESKTMLWEDMTRITGDGTEQHYYNNTVLQLQITTPRIRTSQKGRKRFQVKQLFISETRSQPNLRTHRLNREQKIDHQEADNPRTGISPSVVRGTVVPCHLFPVSFLRRVSSFFNDATEKNRPSYASSRIKNYRNRNCAKFMRIT